MNGKRSVKRSASEGSGGIFRHFRRSSSGSHKSTDLDTATSDAPNGRRSLLGYLHGGMCLHGLLGMVVKLPAAEC